jgi:hypothetical protein
VTTPTLETTPAGPTLADYQRDPAGLIREWAWTGPCYGVHLAALGEDGEEVIAYGHVNPRLMAAAVAKYHRHEQSGATLTYQGRGELFGYAPEVGQTRFNAALEAIGHRWVTVIPHCEYEDLHGKNYDEEHADTPPPDYTGYTDGRPWTLSPEVRAKNDRLRAEHPPGCNCDGPWLSWDDVTADTPGAFPVTVLERV